VPQGRGVGGTPQKKALESGNICAGEIRYEGVWGDPGGEAGTRGTLRESN